MKKFLSILLAALCALLPTLALAQESTTIITTVPSEHLITIVCGNHGGVLIGNRVFTGSLTLRVGRLDTLKVTAVPDSGYGLSKIIVADPDGVSVKGRNVTLSSVHGENTVTICFYQLNASATEDETTDSPFANMPAVTDPILGLPTLADVVTLPWTATLNERLYDELLGTGSGAGQTAIVFDGDYHPQDYELLNIQPEDPKQANSLLVRALPDADGQTARRSLILSVPQLMKLVQKQQTARLMFEDGDALAVMDMADLLGGNLQKLMGLILQQDTAVTSAILSRDWSREQAKLIPAYQLSALRVEVRITPMEPEAYEVSVWLRWGEQALDVSSLIPSLTVCLKADGLAEGADADTLLLLYTVAHQATDTELLESVSMLLPAQLPQQQPDEAELYAVSILENGDAPVVAYTAAAPLSPYRRCYLGASHAGEGSYWIAKRK